MSTGEDFEADDGEVVAGVEGAGFGVEPRVDLVHHLLDGQVGQGFENPAIRRGVERFALLGLKG